MCPAVFDALAVLSPGRLRQVVVLGVGINRRTSASRAADRGKMSADE